MVTSPTHRVRIRFLFLSISYWTGTEPPEPAAQSLRAHRRAADAQTYEFMLSKNFLLVFVSESFDIRNSIASTGFSSLRNLRRIQTRWSVSGVMSSSSLRV